MHVYSMKQINENFNLKIRDPIKACLAMIAAKYTV